MYSAETTDGDPLRVHQLSRDREGDTIHDRQLGPK
jgi:hypothetical protein